MTEFIIIAPGRQLHLREWNHGCRQIDFRARKNIKNICQTAPKGSYHTICEVSNFRIEIRARWNVKDVFLYHEHISLGRMLVSVSNEILSRSMRTPDLNWVHRHKHPITEVTMKISHLTLGPVMYEWKWNADHYTAANHTVHKSDLFLYDSCGLGKMVPYDAVNHLLILTESICLGVVVKHVVFCLVQLKAIFPRDLS